LLLLLLLRNARVKKNEYKKIRIIEKALYRENIRKNATDALLLFNVLFIYLFIYLLIFIIFSI
jgi:hypothetical protein